MRCGVLRLMVVCVVAIGLIAQAAALVRHNGTALSKSFEASLETSVAGSTQAAIAALAFDLTWANCMPGNGGEADGHDAPPGGSHRQTGSDCPICSGLVSAYGVAACDGFALPASMGSTAIAFPPTDKRDTYQRMIRPPSRGPPSHA